MTITADFSGGEKTVTTEPLYQWDTGQKLALSGLPQTASDIQVHFANAAMAQAIVKATATENSLPTCDIPNEFLQFGSAAKARAWVYFKEGSSKGYTIKTVLIPITPRKRPNDYVSPEDPDSQGIVERAIELLEGYEDDLASKLSAAPGAVDTENLADESITVEKVADDLAAVINAKEEKSNKKTTLTGNESSNDFYPTTKAVADALNTKVSSLSNRLALHISVGFNANGVPVKFVNGVSIPSGAFAHDEITKIFISQDVQTISGGAFSGCPALSDIYFDSTSTTYDSGTIPSGVTAHTLDNYHIMNCILDCVKYLDDNQNKVIAEEVGELKSALDDVYDNNGVPAQNLTISDFTSQDCYKTNGESQVFDGDWVSTDFIPCYGSTVKYKGYAFWSSSVDLAVVAFFGVDKQMTHYIASSEVLSAIGNGTVSGEVSTQPGDYYVRVISYTSRVSDSYVIVSAGNLYSKLSVVDGLADAVDGLADAVKVQNKVIAEEIGELKSALDDVYDNNGVPAQNLTISDFTSQDCYKTNGESQVFDGDWVSTDFIPCYGSTVKYKGYAFRSSSVDLAVVAFFGVDKQMTHCIASSEVLSAIGNGTVSGEVSTQPGDYYVRVISYTSRVSDSYVIVSAGNLYSKLSVVDGLADTVGVSGIEIEYNGFTSDQILLENGTFQSYGEQWRSTDYISCFGAKSVQYTATPFHGNGVNLVAYVAFFDKDKNLISFLDSSSFPFGYHVNQTGSADVPQNAYYVRIVGQDSKCRLSIESTGLKQFTDFKASDLKILCIGDSLTRGVINADADIIRESYPYWVGKTLSSYAANAGYPGGVPRTWWARRANYEQPTADTDLVLIMFGTNGELTQNTLATDVGPYTDYADYADTSVGCYCKIIEWIMEQTSNHAQIILMTPPMPWPTTRDESYARGKYNTCLDSLPVIRAIAGRYALPVIDVFYGSGMNKYNGSVFRPNDGLHFGAKGYHKLGTFIARQVASMYSTFDVDETGTVIS